VGCEGDSGDVMFKSSRILIHLGLKPQAIG
jgi:hypothetical protein